MTASDESKWTTALIKFLSDHKTEIESLPKSAFASGQFHLTENTKSSGFKEGLFMEKDKQLSFVSNFIKDYFIQFKAVQEVINSDNPILAEVKQNHFVNTSFLVVLNRVYKTDTSVLMLEVDASTVWQVFKPWCDSLKFSELKTETLITALQSITALAENDGAGGGIYPGLKQFAEHQPENGKNLVNKILEDSEFKLFTYVPHLYSGLSNVEDVDNIFDQLELLADHHSFENQKAAIQALGLLNFTRSKNDHELLKKTNEILEEKIGKSAELNAVVAQVYGELVDKLPGAKTKLEQLSESEDPSTLHVIANIVWRFKLEDDQEWFKQAVFNLAKVRPEHIGTIRMIVYALAEKTVSHPHIIDGFFERWILYEHNNANQIKSFDYLITKVYSNNPNLLKLLTTRWLMHENIRFQLVVGEIFLLLFSHKIHDLDLDEESIKNYSFDDIKLLVFRILGFTIHKEHLQSLLYSVLQHAKKSENVQGLIITGFTHYVVYNYPSAIDYLKVKKSTADKYRKYVINQVSEYWTNYTKQLESLGRAKELFASEIRQRVYARAMQKRYANALDKGEKSPIMSMVTVINVKECRFMLHKYDNQYSEKNELRSIQFSAEMPRGEAIDPLGQARQRYSWKMRKK